MKKFIALLLLLGVCLTSSCIDRSGTDDDVSTDETTIEETTAAETEYLETKAAMSITITTKMPVVDPDYQDQDIPPLKNIFTYSWQEDKIQLESFKKISIGSKYCFMTLINDIDLFKQYFESISEKNYEDCYDSDFFERYFVVILKGYENLFGPFDSFEYSFDTQKHMLSITFYCNPQQGYTNAFSEDVGNYIHLVSIPKEDIEIDAKEISIENINIQINKRED